MSCESNVKICVVTVTYGNRGHLLEKMLHALDTSTVNVDRVVIVDNGSISSFESFFSRDSYKIEIVKLGRNTGSAAGFKSGLQRAAVTDCELIWLLDDDNVPESRALEMILEQRGILGNNEMHVFAAQRIDREKYVRAATTDFILEVKNNAFLGFTLSDLLRRAWKKFAVNSQLESTSINATRVKKISYGIYGGLLFHNSWLSKAIYPDDDFYLYMDDTEYTTRLVQNGAQIYLVPESRIRDIDISWSQKSRKNLPPILDMDVDIQKLYYTIRNSCYLSKDRFVDNWGIFYINVVSFLLLIFIKGILAGNSFFSMTERFKLVVHAISDGIRGRLGYRESIPGMLK
jgi:GT2 family glycosyltransferase